MVRQWPVQQAIYGAMTADATLMGMVTGIFDGPNQNQQLPYITIGESTGTADDLVIETGAQTTHTMQVWDKSQGMARVKQIMDRITVVLHRKQLTITGTQAVECVLEFAETFRDADGETRRGAMRFRVATFL